MKNAISKHPLLSFFAMAFLFSWMAVLPLLLSHALPIEPFQILGALAGPTLAAVIVIGVTAGKAGLATFFKRYVQWRAGIIWRMDGGRASGADRIQCGIFHDHDVGLQQHAGKHLADDPAALFE